MGDFMGQNSNVYNPFIDNKQEQNQKQSKNR